MNSDGLANMFSAIGPSEQPAMAPTQPTLGAQVQQPVAGQNFQDMAMRMGLDTSALHKNPSVAKLQLMNQLHQRIGPDFMQHPDVPNLLQAFDSSQPKTDSSSQRTQFNAMNSQAQRTLGALMKVNGS